MNGMFNAIKVGYDLTNILLSAPILQNVNIAFYRQLRLQHVVDFQTIATTPRNGCSGAGIIICEPSARGLQKNVLALDWIFGIACIECPTINDLQSGANLSAYQMAHIVADIIHNWADDSYGTMNVDNIAIEDEHDFVFEGFLSKRTNFHCTGKNNQTVRCGQIQGVAADGFITLSCALNPTATIYYTLDGSTPVSTNPVAQIYSAPVAVNSGQNVRAMGFYTGLNQSSCMNVMIP